jgi:hypothetical protein
MGLNRLLRGQSSPVYLCILLRLCIKFLFAAGSAEVILFPLIFAGELCRFLINRHFADRINRQCFYLSYFPFFASGKYFLSNRERLTTVTELSAIASAASSGLNTKPKDG